MSKRAFVIFKSFALVALFVFTTSSCSTVRQQKEAELAVLQQVRSHSETLLADLRAGTVPPAAYDFHLFFSYSVLNDALSYLDNFSFPLPNDTSVIINISQIRIQSTGALPTANMVASARKGDLVADLDLDLVMIPTNVSPDQAEFRFKVLRLVPKIRWWQFQLATSSLVKSFIAAELEKIADQLPSVTVPLSQTITLGGPQRISRETLDTGTNSQGDQTSIDVMVRTPQTSHEKSVSITSYIFLSKGLHIFGGIE